MTPRGFHNNRSSAHCGNRRVQTGNRPKDPTQSSPAQQRAWHPVSWAYRTVSGTRRAKCTCARQDRDYRWPWWSQWKFCIAQDYRACRKSWWLSMVIRSLSSGHFQSIRIPYQSFLLQLFSFPEGQAACVKHSWCRYQALQAPSLCLRQHRETFDEGNFRHPDCDGSSALDILFTVSKPDAIEHRVSLTCEIQVSTK